VPELHWLGDNDAKRAARRVPYRLLEPVSQVGDAAAQNLLIQGDNLEALKALLPFYAGRVKCIFIDPPYNTKSAFAHYDDNLEHSQWLSMMYPRLELLRDLLSEDGSIWVTIDDNEAHYLKVVMDEVFGRKNFVANVVWQKKYAVASDSKGFSDFHDHILIYAKNGLLTRNLLPRTDKQNSLYKYNDLDGNGPWRTDNLSVKTYSENYNYPLQNPVTGVEYWPPRGRCWYTSKEKMIDLVNRNGVYFGKDGTGAPQLKRYLNRVQDGVVPSTWWAHDDVGHNDESRKESKTIFDNEPFSTPKPERLLNRVLHIATNINDLVLDSYLGSATTAAVAHKMGRRYIGIEMGEHAATHCLPRLQKVVDGEQGGISDAVGWKGGGGFRFMKLGESVFLDNGSINPAVRFATLASYLWFLETGSPHATNTFATPLLGIMGGEVADALDSTIEQTHRPRTAIILLYNGILGDRRPQAGNVLTHAIWNGILAQLPPHDGPRLIYGEACRLSAQKLKQLNVMFKQIPYDIRMR
jgi:adenine-specific DNA-methyltransferase